VSGPRVVNDSSREAMKQILAEIQDGTFANNFMQEWESGAENYNRMRAEGRGELIEKVGAELRAMMSWIDTPTLPD
jgi:ketol-acid reductoisomerase